MYEYGAATMDWFWLFFSTEAPVFWEKYGVLSLTEVPKIDMERELGENLVYKESIFLICLLKPIEL